VSANDADAFDASRHWRLDNQVSLRDESFGALAYHHGNRRLVFLKSPELTALVRRLGDFASAESALAALTPPGERARYLDALAALQRSELLNGC
jgi:putative mycofactocin binding protein MftB